MFQDFLLQVVENRTIKEGVFDNYLYSPIRSFFSFGYQQAEQERLQQEAERQQSYKKLVENTDYGAQEYPGYEENQNLKKQ